MKLVVAGGTGLVGQLVVEASQSAGLDVAVISRSQGTDLTAGTGLADALTGADVVIDVTNAAGVSRAKSVGFFETATRNLLAAEKDAGVGHHVALSIVGVDRVPSGYYAGKLRQEQLIAAADRPWTVLRATQFHEFPAQLLARVKGPIAAIPVMRSATVAAREVAQLLVEVASGPALDRIEELSGPEVHELPALARAIVKARGEHRWVLPVRLPGRAGSLMANGGQLPVVPGRVSKQTFDEWLGEQPR